ncbi:hypothetical protein AMJ80_00975 [bacterium SM23_31]|nr:MAG: hypothetical protein AMJ80_00975 [bacterium SM23_31]
MNTLLNYINYLPAGSVWFELVMAIFIKGGLILCAAFAVTLIWKSASSAARHLVWSAAFVSILIMPLLSFVMPAWEIASLTSYSTSRTPQPQDMISSPLNFEDENLSNQHIRQDGNLESSVNSDSETTTSIIKDPVHTNNGGIISNAVPVMQNIFNRLPWSVLLLLLWMSGAIFVFMRILIKLTGLWLMVKKADPLQDTVFNKLIVDCRKRTGLKRNIRLLQSKWITVPVAWGLFRPAIVVPKGAELWSDKQKEIVLLHEAAHIKRADFLSTLIAHTTSVIYWCNPLIWSALRRFYIERENACDDYVLSLGTKPSVYASNLLEVAKEVKSLKWASHLELAFVRNNKLEGRIMEILNSSKQRTALKPVTMFFVGLLAVSFLIPVSSIQTHAQKQVQEESNVLEQNNLQSQSNNRQVIKDVQEFSSFLEADREVNLTALKTGIIKEIKVKEGDKVSAGDVLLVLENDEETLLLNETRLNLKLAQIEFEGVKEGFEKGFLTDLEFMRGEIKLNQAESDMKRAEIQLKKTQITAPFGGIVVVIVPQLEIGQLLEVNKPVFSVVKFEPLNVTVYVPHQEYYSSFKIGNEAKIMYGENLSSKAVIVEKSPIIDVKRGGLRLKLTVKGENKDLIPGMIVRVIF